MKSPEKLTKLLDKFFKGDEDLELGDKGYSVEINDEYTHITIYNVAHDQWPVFIFENVKFAYIDIVGADY